MLSTCSSVSLQCSCFFCLLLMWTSCFSSLLMRAFCVCSSFKLSNGYFRMPFTRKMEKGESPVEVVRMAYPVVHVYINVFLYCYRLVYFFTRRSEKGCKHCCKLHKHASRDNFLRTPMFTRATKILVFFAAVIRVVTQRSSPLTAAHWSSAFRSSN